ncbi:MAG: hypothetical protein V4637_11475, partial [Pseudomonadota bacterium]
MSDNAATRAGLHLDKRATGHTDDASISANGDEREVSATADRPRAAEAADFDEHAVEALAARILHGWLRNRHQLLVPFSIDLQKLEASQV